MPNRHFLRSDIFTFAMVYSFYFRLFPNELNSKIVYTLRYHFKGVRKAKDKMRYFDIKKWLWLAGILYTFLQGYTFYTRREGEAAVGCALLCAICIYQFIRRLCTLYYLHMTMKRIDKLSGRAFERYLTIQFRHLGYRVKLTSYSHDYGQILFFVNGEKRRLFRQSVMKGMLGLLPYRKLSVLLRTIRQIMPW